MQAIRITNCGSHSLPFYDVPAGYPSAAQDYMEQQLDITEYMLGPRRASIFLFKIVGMSMRDAGILDGDIIIVDRSLDVKDGHIVVAAVDGQYTCKYYRNTKKGVWLQAANPDYKPIRIFRQGYKYRKGGVMLMGLEPLKERQYDLLSPRNEAKEERLMEVLDKINHKYGSQTLFYAAAGIKQEWQMMRQMKSPNYTTRWEEIPCIT